MPSSPQGPALLKCLGAFHAPREAGFHLSRGAHGSKRDPFLAMFHGENGGKSWENHGKMEENHGKIIGISWENHGKPTKIMGKSWERLRKSRKFMQKTWEHLGSVVGTFRTNHGKIEVKLSERGGTS